MNLTEEKNLAGCCGLYCGLCPRYQSTAASQCPGCKILSLTISCKLYNCCVKKKGFEACAECGEFPCDKYDKFFDWDSFISHKVCLPNLEHIKKVGLKKWLGEQSKKRQALENLLVNYNEGWSCSFFCVATVLMPIDSITKAVNEANKMCVLNNVDELDLKNKSKILRSVIQDLALKSRIDLKLRKKQK